MPGVDRKETEHTCYEGQEQEPGKCPFCGAEDVGLLNFGCRTHAISIPLITAEAALEYYRGDACYEREIADLRRRLELWHTFWEELYISDANIDALDALKAAGEIER